MKRECRTPSLRPSLRLTLLTLRKTGFYAAFCIGCDSRGIELIKSRYKSSVLLREKLQSFNKNGPKKAIGKIDLRHGSLDHPKFEKFQTEGVTKVFVNNYGSVFSERSGVIKVGSYPDDVVPNFHMAQHLHKDLRNFGPAPV